VTAFSRARFNRREGDKCGDAWEFSSRGKTPEKIG
jgi:hypothetical protein